MDLGPLRRRDDLGRRRPLRLSLYARLRLDLVRLAVGSRSLSVWRLGSPFLLSARMARPLGGSPARRRSAAWFASPSLVTVVAVLSPRMNAKRGLIIVNDKRSRWVLVGLGLYPRSWRPARRVQ